jgi:fructose-specific phosphotransferase system IIA component
MKLNDFMKIEDIKLNLTSTNKQDVISELAHLMNEQGYVNNLEGLIEDVKKREALDSTGIGLKIALPHAKTPFIDQPSVVFGRSDEGVSFESLDGQRAHLFFLICIPEDGVNLHLKVLAMLSRSLIHESFRNELLNAKTPQEVMDILKRVE